MAFQKPDKWAGTGGTNICLAEVDSEVHDAGEQTLDGLREHVTKFATQFPPIPN